MPEAIMQRTYGKSNVLNIEKIYVNDPADDEILIKQTAIGIHFHDIYVRTGLYKTLNLPGIPGVEASGIIEKSFLFTCAFELFDDILEGVSLGYDTFEMLL